MIPITGAALVRVSYRLGLGGSLRGAPPRSTAFASASGVAPRNDARAVTLPEAMLV